MIVGTPVIISDQTPWNDVMIDRNKSAISLKDSNLFKELITLIIKMDSLQAQGLYKQTVDYAMTRMNVESIKNKYIEESSKVLIDAQRK